MRMKARIGSVGLAALMSAAALQAGDPAITSVQTLNNALRSPVETLGQGLRGNPSADAMFDQFRGAVGVPAQRMISTQPKLGLKRPLVRCNKCIKGQLVDYTHNHGADNRIYSQVLGEKRDLYVYLPPGYTPGRHYPLILWLHGAFGDEHAFIDGGRFDKLEELMAKGLCPPVVMVCPDGTYEGKNRLNSHHSYYVNGLGGAYEDFLMLEVLPWIEQEFSILPAREARAIFGISGGGYGGMSLAIRRRDYFGSVAVLAAPVNMRYQTCDNRYFANFNPATFQWNEDYNSRRVVGKFFGCILKLEAGTLLRHVFGNGDEAIENVRATNPADLIFSSNLQPGELNIFLHYPGKDNFNFDAHAESFAWLAASRGIEVATERDPHAHHLVRYFRQNICKAYAFLGQRLARPADDEPAPSTSAANPPIAPATGTDAETTSAATSHSPSPTAR